MTTSAQLPNNETVNATSIKNPRFADHFTKRNLKKEGFKGVSLTIPDQNLSLKEMLLRFARGQEIPQKTPVYGVDDELANVQGLDSFEKMDLAQQNQEYINTLEKEIQSPPIESSSTSTAPPEPSSATGTDEPAKQ